MKELTLRELETLTVGGTHVGAVLSVIGIGVGLWNIWDRHHLAKSGRLPSRRQATREARGR